MPNPLHIFQGIFNSFRKELGIPNEEIENISENKLKICYSCPIRTENKCDKSKGGCGCFIKHKVRSDSKCPLNKF